MENQRTAAPEKMYFYERFASDFDSKMNMYDTVKRVDVVYNELLTENLKDKKLLDAGCGTGWFSKAAGERGARVTSMDVGPNLLEQVKKKVEGERVVGSIMEMPFEDNTFDFVVSSEVIEHIPDHRAAISEIYRVLKPGGTVVLTTPNKVWYFAIWIANTFKLRPYEGLENWLSWGGLKKLFIQEDFKIEEMVGIHMFPFVSPIFYPILNFFHKFNKTFLGKLMLNQAIKANKPK